MIGHVSSPRRLLWLSSFFLTAFFFDHTDALSSEPVWHCSRSTPGNQSSAQSSVESKSGSSSLRTLDFSESLTIEILPIDLLKIYSGDKVQMGARTLSACYFERNHPLTISAMNMLDIDASSLTSISTADSIVRGNIFSVRTTNQMLSCIARNHPAVGFLDKVVETDQVSPCF